MSFVSPHRLLNIKYDYKDSRILLTQAHPGAYEYIIKAQISFLYFHFFFNRVILVMPQPLFRRICSSTIDAPYWFDFVLLTNNLKELYWTNHHIFFPSSVLLMIAQFISKWLIIGEISFCFLILCGVYTWYTHTVGGN